MARLGAESANAQKSKQMSRVGDEGTAHGKGEGRGCLLMPCFGFSCLLRALLASSSWRISFWSASFLHCAIASQSATHGDVETVGKLIHKLS